MIPITINELRRYRRLIAERKAIMSELDGLIIKSKAFDGIGGNSNAIADTVSEIVLQRDKKRKNIEALTKRINAVEAYIQHCDGYYSVLLQWHYINGKSWRYISAKIGGGNTEDSIKKACHRYILKNP